MLISRFFITMKIQKESKASSIKYFIFQEISSWGILLRMFYGNLFIPILGVIFKIGLPPFHLWLIRVINKIQENIKWPLIASKILPCGVSLIFIKSLLIPLIIILFRIYFFSYSFGLKEVLIMRRGYNISWVLITSEEIFFFSLYFLLTYLMFIFYIINITKKNSPELGIEYLILLRLPPRGFFFIKLFIISEIGVSILAFLLLILLLGFILMIYLKVYEHLGYNIFYKKNKIFSEKGGWVRIFIFFILILISFS